MFIILPFLKRNKHNLFGLYLMCEPCFEATLQTSCMMLPYTGRVTAILNILIDFGRVTYCCIHHTYFVHYFIKGANVLQTLDQ